MKDFRKDSNINYWLGSSSEYTQQLDSLAFLIAIKLKKSEQKYSVVKSEHRKDK